MFEEIKKAVCTGNKKLKELGLVIQTWGNLSAIDPQTGYVAIKPSGVSYDTMTYDDIVVLDLEGRKIEGDLNPSSDTETHLELYRNYSSIKSIIHTHSKYATVFAQAGKAIECLGTTHADYFYGSVPCIPELSTSQIQRDYELNTGVAIVNYFKDNSISPSEMPACIVKGHGPFVWGQSVDSALLNAEVLEAVAHMNLLTYELNPSCMALKNELLDKHFLRKHGKNAYYGQS